MAKMIDDDIHHMAASFIATKYTTHADERQRAMGLAYVTAEKDDLIREVAAFARRMVDLMQEEA
ncbi:hypothetical protein EHS39_11655 [Ensifer sp. MPMI2T]|nr:hypothetical protein EHS39_11655 [Ensifer sp. MPMI2T]